MHPWWRRIAGTCHRPRPWVLVSIEEVAWEQIIIVARRYRVTILNSDGEKFMQSFHDPVFNVTHFADSGLLWLQVRAKSQNGFSNTIHIEINFEKEGGDESAPMITGQEMTISLLPILCLLAGSLAVLLSIVAGILECSRRKYNVSNEVTHISFSNNLDLNPSKIVITNEI